MLLTGCSVLLEDGDAEAARLVDVVETLDGVESVWGSGSQQSFTFGAYAGVHVTLAETATCADLEALLQTWGSEAYRDDYDGTARKVLYAELTARDMSVEIEYDISEERLRDVAAFACAVPDFPGTHIFIDEVTSGRSVSFQFPERETVPEELDVDALRQLPGAVTKHDYWIIGQHEYRWSHRDLTDVGLAGVGDEVNLVTVEQLIVERASLVGASVADFSPTAISGVSIPVKRTRTVSSAFSTSSALSGGCGSSAP